MRNRRFLNISTSTGSRCMYNNRNMIWRQCSRSTADAKSLVSVYDTISLYNIIICYYYTRCSERLSDTDAISTREPCRSSKIHFTYYNTCTYIVYCRRKFYQNVLATVAISSPVRIYIYIHTCSLQTSIENRNMPRAR